MPNAGPAPDCVHCRWMTRREDGTYLCQKHRLILHSPVRIFCKFIEPTDEDPEYQEWFESTFASQPLQPKVIYIWLETLMRDSRGQSYTRFDWGLLAPFSVYRKWSAETFWEVVRGMINDRRDYYQRMGYELDGPSS